MRRLATAILVGALAALTSCSFGGGGTHTYRAEFARAIQVFPAVKVRVLGVDVGEVVGVRNAGQGAEVTFRVDDGVQLPAQVNAAVVPMSLLGERYIQLFPAYGGGPALSPGSTIPMSRTAVPSEPDELLRSLQNYLGGLDPASVTRFVDNASQVVEGSGEDLNRLLEHGAGVLSTLAAKRDDLADIIVQLDKVTKALSTRQAALGQLIDDYGVVVGTVDANRTALEGTIDGLNKASLQLASLLGAHLDPLHADVETLTRAGQTIDRNVDSIALTQKWATGLFSAASRAVDYTHDMLRLGNQGQELGPLIVMRLEERLMELCLDTGQVQCANPLYWAQKVPSLFCYDPSMCPKAGRKVGPR